MLHDEDGMLHDATHFSSNRSKKYSTAPGQAGIEKMSSRQAGIEILESPDEDRLLHFASTRGKRVLMLLRKEESQDPSKRIVLPSTVKCYKITKNP